MLRSLSNLPDPTEAAAGWRTTEDSASSWLPVHLSGGMRSTTQCYEQRFWVQPHPQAAATARSACRGTMVRPIVPLLA